MSESVGRLAVKQPCPRQSPACRRTDSMMADYTSCEGCCGDGFRWVVTETPVDLSEIEELRAHKARSHEAIDFGVANAKKLREERNAVRAELTAMIRRDDLEAFIAERPYGRPLPQPYGSHWRDGYQAALSDLRAAVLATGTEANDG